MNRACQDLAYARFCRRQLGGNKAKSRAPLDDVIETACTLASNRKSDFDAEDRDLRCHRLAEQRVILRHRDQA